MSTNDKGFVDKAEATGNRVDIPGTRNLGPVEFVKQILKQSGEDNLAAFAGSLVYSAVFAVFPFMTLLLSLLGLFHLTDLVNQMTKYAGQFMPGGAANFLTSGIINLTKSQANSAFTVGAIVSMIVALWGISGGIRSVMTAMNVMYNVTDDRPFWKKYLISIAISIGAIVLLIVSLVLLVFGPKIGGSVADLVGLGSTFHTVWNIARWPVLIFLVLLTFALIYYFCPNVQQRFRIFSPGNILAVILWLVFSYLFSLYVSSFGSYNKTYGAFAGIAIFLLYLYYSSYILLLGAEMNQVIASHSKSPPSDRDNTEGETA